MSLVRAIHKIYYAKAEHRFKSPAFEASNDGGISVFSSDCAIGNSQSICEHLNKYYVPIGIASTPAIYWEFDEQILPTGCQREPVIEEGKDPCHENIKGMTKKQSKNYKQKAASN